MMVCELKLYNDEKWFLCACYKPPRVKEKKFIDTLENVCNSLLRESHHWLVVGDVNIDMNQENLLTTFYNTHDLQKGPTCFKGENPTCIDVILSNEPNRFKSTINVNCSLSDFHNIVCTATKLQCPPELGGGRVTRFPFGPLNVFVYISHWAARVNTQNRPHFEGDFRNLWLTRALLYAIQLAASRRNMIAYLCKIGT